MQTKTSERLRLFYSDQSEQLGFEKRALSTKITKGAHQ